MAIRIHVCLDLVLRSVTIVAGVTFVITGMVVEGVHMLVDGLLATEAAIAGIAFPAFSVRFVITSMVVEGVHMLVDGLLTTEAAIAGIACPGFVRSMGRAGLEMLLNGTFGIEPAVAILAPIHREFGDSLCW